MNKKIVMKARISTWVLVNLCEGKDVIRLKWIFKKKYVILKNTRLDGGEVSISPVVCMGRIRIVLSLVGQKELHVLQHYVNSSFPRGKMEEEAYVDRNHCYVVKGKEDKSIDRSGLKQALISWNSKINSSFIEMETEKPKGTSTLRKVIGKFSHLM